MNEKSGTFLPFSKVGKKMESQVRKAMFDLDLVEDPSIAIALSGGKDSLSLMIMLHAISGKGFPKFSLHAIHVEGEKTCGGSVNRSFLKNVCSSLNIPLILQKAPVIENNECYYCSRIRRKIIFDTARKLNVSTVAFGHHRDDAIQTLLLNLYHKGEFASLLPKVPMIRYKVTIIRPLIYVAEKDIIEFARQNNFLANSVQCPFGRDSKRKEVERLIQQMENSFPHVRKNLFHASVNYGSKKALNI
ncbi:MAG: tRNA 2-thiocytidine biosynthesis protein TtcA [Parachlamydiales bacterium]|nr:tRNA 2-thiocytidine biosynthesis protein TtcA [Parachlamydiales bacterium]